MPARKWEGYFLRILHPCQSQPTIAREHARAATAHRWQEPTQYQQFHKTEDAVSEAYKTWHAKTQFSDVSVGDTRERSLN